MKLISLNTWGGVLYKELSEFLVKHATDVDIFCLQEIFHEAVNLRPIYKEMIPHKGVRANLFSDISKLLPDFHGFYAHRHDNEEGLAIFARKDLQIGEAGDVFVYKDRNTMIGDDGTTVGINIQYLEILENDKKCTVVNFHGMWTGKGKGDTPERVEQSKNIMNFLNSVSGPKLICGDFNLLPKIESMKILETNMKNLIKEYNVTSTRSSYYHNGDGQTKFADYVLVSNDIKVKDFMVLKDVVSDHLPLLLEFSF